MEKKPFWSGPRKPMNSGPRPQAGRNKFRGNQKKDKDELAINDQIRAREVRLVGEMWKKEFILSQRLLKLPTI